MMKLIAPLLLLLLVLGCHAQQSIQIIPEPVSVTTAPGVFKTGRELAVYTDDPLLLPILQEMLAMTGTHMRPVPDRKVAKLEISLIKTFAAEPEGKYTLVVTPDHVLIQASQSAGLFYGVQSFLQLMVNNNLTIPSCTITDYPRFTWRGLHLDVCRHFFPPEFVKRYIDLMARYKFNRFHWHLTEDQGWRIEIKKYPKLQEVAAYRKETLIGHYSDEPHKFDGTRYGGYYTQEEIREIVAYAAQRHVTIVPEIEMPGHSLAALSAYPQLGCTGGPYEAATLWGVFDDVYCAGKEETFTFLQDVLDEVITLFPGTYVHVGGDECPKERWKKCPHCQKRMKDENLKDEHELQSYFIQRMEKYLNSKGKQIIGWDEILEGGLAPNATVMSWRGESGGIAAARSGHDVVMSPGFALYFDHYQSQGKPEPLAIGGWTPLRKVYEYDPLPATLTDAEAKHILGAQANVWTEYIQAMPQVEYMVYPRALALAEVVWSPKEKRNWDTFAAKFRTHFRYLGLNHVNFRRPIAGDDDRVGNLTVTVKSAAGKPQDNHTVLVFRAADDITQNKPAYTSTTQADGRAQFQSIPAGTYRVLISNGNNNTFISQETSVEIKPWDTSRKEISVNN